MSRESRFIRAFIAFACTAALLPSAASAASIVVQDVDVAAYPDVTLDLALSSDLVPAQGVPKFTVLENGIEVPDVKAKLLAEERPPVDVVLVLDESGSMEGAPLAAAQEAAKRFVAAMSPQDRVAIVAFSSEPRVLSGFTSDPAQLTAAIDALEAQGETALYDGLMRGVKVFEDNGRDRYITVLSDGGDTTSINSIDAASDAVNAAGAPVYAVALESPEYDPAVLGALADNSGGRLVSAADVGELTGIFEGIAQELRNAFSVTFTSARPSTKDLEIEIVATNGDSTGSLVTAVENPVHTEAALTDVTSSVTSAATSAVTLLAIALLCVVAVGGLIWAIGSMLAPAPNTLDQLRYYEQYSAEDRRLDPGAQVQTSRGRIMDAVAYVSDRRGFTGEVSASLERAGLPLRANEYIFFHIVATALAGAVVQLLSGSLVASVVTVAIVVIAPIVWLRIRISKRRAAFEEQLPDVLSLIAGSLRAGWGIQQSIGLVVQEVGEPSAGEFRRVESETRFGLPFEEALRRMADRLQSEDFSWTVTAVSIQREVGGNLAEVLDIVANTVRQRAELKRHVSSLTAESRFSAVVLSILPFFLFGALAVVSPEYLALALQETMGLIAFGFGAVLLVIGIVWITRLTKVEV